MSSWLCSSYGCLPTIGQADAPGSVELVLSARASVPADVTLSRAEEKLQAAVQAVVGRVVSGVIV